MKRGFTDGRQGRAKKGRVSEKEKYSISWLTTYVFLAALILSRVKFHNDENCFRKVAFPSTKANRRSPIVSPNSVAYFFRFHPTNTIR